VIYNKFKDKHIIKHAIFYCSLLFIINTSLADDFTKEKNIKFVITPSIAYRYDVFKWSTSNCFFTNKKLSELVWKNRIMQPSIKVEIEPQPKQFNFLIQTKYGYILKDTSNSWDYDWFSFSDKNENVYSIEQKTKSLTTGNILDLSGAIGYSVNLSKNNLLTFYIGHNYTDYKNKNYGIYSFSNDKIYQSSNTLVRKYYFKNKASWIGLSIITSLNEIITIIPTIKFYSFKHDGKGYWLLREDLNQNPSFKDKAKGRGIGFNIDLLYKYSSNLDYKINLEIEKFKMKKGNNIMFTKIDDFNNKLYDLSLRSSSISIGFKYKL
jgi:hypothetical protein